MNREGVITTDSEPPFVFVSQDICKNKYDQTKRECDDIKKKKAFVRVFGKSKHIYIRMHAKTPSFSSPSLACSRALSPFSLASLLTLLYCLTRLRCLLKSSFSSSSSSRLQESSK